LDGRFQEGHPGDSCENHTCIPGNTKGGSSTVLLTSCLTGLEKYVLQIKTKKIVSCHTADSKPVKQEVNGTVILPPLVFPDVYYDLYVCNTKLPEYKSLK